MSRKPISVAGIKAGIGITARAETLAGGLPALVLAAERLAAHVAAGRHGRRRAGMGDEFWQFRDFRDGDAPREIDWRRSARGSTVFLRERELESAEILRLHIADHPGMAWRSDPSLPTKQERAILLALACASLALRGGEMVGLAGRTRPLRGPHALEGLAQAMGQTGQDQALNAGRPAWFGDFLDDPAALAVSLAGSGKAGVLVQILDPAEIEFPYQGRILFEGPAGEKPEDISRAQAVREAYLARLDAQREAVRQAALAAGLTPLFHRTDAAPAPALAAIYAALRPA